LTVPIQANVTLDGTQFCGSVPGFQNATFIPILRSNAVIVEMVVNPSTSVSRTTLTQAPTSTPTHVTSTTSVSRITFSQAPTSTPTHVFSLGYLTSSSLTVNLFCVFVFVMFV
jgi:hypothetical protein